MGDANKYVCRLCLDMTPACECETINEIKKEILEFLLIDIDIDISDYAVACSRCLERLQNCFDFKSHITTFVATDVKVDIKGFERKMASNEISKVCELCMLLIKDEDFDYITDWKDGVPLEDMISSCLPEIGLNIVQERLICKPCVSSTKKFYEFMKNCQEVGQRIENYCQMAGRGIVGKVILEDLLKLEDYDMLSKSIIIKKECLDVENVGVNVMECVKSEEIARIQCEAIDIKDELDNGVESMQSDQSEDYDTSGMNGFSKNIRKNAAGGKKHSCPKCSYSSNKSSDIKKHMRAHSDKEVYKCGLCPFVTDARSLLNTHMNIHRGPTKAFSCPECPYKTYFNCSMVRHSLKHKDESEVEMHKCSLCPYKSKYKETVIAHRKRQHEENTETYKCKECSFSTKYEANLVSHQLVHMKPEAIPMYKCEKCEFETKRKRCLVLHMAIHEDPKVANKFKCEKCSYRGKTRSYVTKHMMVHLDKHLFSCDKCAYSSNKRGNVIRHKQRIHQKVSQTDV